LHTYRHPLHCCQSITMETESIPNSDFGSHGFQFDPLEADRATGFALEFWHCKFDLDKKSASVRGLQKRLGEMTVSFKRATETNMEMRRVAKARDLELAALQEEISELKENARKEKQTTGLHTRTIAKDRTHMLAQDTELKVKVAALKAAEVHVAQLTQSYNEETEKAAHKIHMLSERNANLSTNLNELREIEGITARQLEEVKIERDHLLGKVFNQQNLIDHKENSHFSKREQAKPTEDLLALEEVCFKSLFIIFLIRVGHNDTTTNSYIFIHYYCYCCGSFHRRHTKSYMAN
jgi:hypothetical protein